MKLLWSSESDYRVVFIVLLFGFGFCDSATLVITAVIYGLPSREMISGLPSILPGYTMGFEDLRTKYGFHVDVTVITSPLIRRCDDIGAYVYLIPEFYYTKSKPDSLFLLFYIGCDEVLQLSSLSTEWNTLLIGSGGWNNAVASPSFVKSSNSAPGPFSTTISLSVYSYPQIVRAAFALLTLYSWTTVSVVHVEHPTFIGLQAMLKRIHVDLYTGLRMSFFYLSNDEDLNNAVLFDRIQKTCRVILLLMPAQTVRRFMASASKQGLNGGEYVFIAVEPFENERRYGSIDQSFSDHLGSQQTLLQLTPNCTSEKPAVDLRLMDVLKNESVVKYDAVFWPSEKPHIALSVYHSVLAVGYVLNESFHAAMNLSDGRALASVFADRDIALDGMILRTDHGNTLLVDFCVKDFNPEKGCFMPVLQYDGARGIFTAVAGRKIDWHRSLADGAPPNEPFCGFLGNNPRCQGGRVSNLISTVLGVLVALFVIGVLAGIAMHRITSSRRREPQWELDTEDLITSPDRCYSTRTRSWLGTGYS